MAVEHRPFISELFFEGIPHNLEQKVSLLSEYEEKTVCVLSEVEIMSLCRSLYKRCLIPLEVRNKILSLDHENLSKELIIRYLVQSVHKAIQNEEADYNTFIEVIQELIGCVPGDLKGALFKFELANMLDFGVIRTNTMEDESFNFHTYLRNYVLSVGDILVLMELLVEVSHKWEELGIVLGLKTFQIEQCRNAGSNVLRLNEVLKQWIFNTAHPTMAVLITALSSDIVSMKNLAASLEKQIHTEVKEYDTKKEYQTLKPIYRSGDILVKRGKSAILGFQVTFNPLLKFKWKRNGQNLSESNTYSGTETPYLFVESVQGDIKGDYECFVSDSVDEVRSEIMRLETQKLYQNKFSQHFKNIYRKREDIPKDSWPPVVNSEFVTLALIKKSRQPACEPLDYTVQNTIDDVIANKEIVQYEDIFREYQTQTLFLVEGRPGSGKTTLVHKVTKDWAEKREILIDCEIIIFVPLRLFFSSSNEDIDLMKMLEIYIDSEKERKIVAEAITQKNGERVCFIIDGLDEYEDRNVSDKTIYRLIHKLMLPLSMVIVASRPVGTAYVRNRAPVTERIEVLGFGNQQIESYILSYFSDQIEMGNSLMSYLHLHVNVLHMCYLPVHVAMICFVYREEKDSIPQRETKIYEFFTCLTLVRKVSRDNLIHSRIHSLGSLSGELKKYFDNICRLAYIMTVNSRQVISQSEVQFPLSFMPGSDIPSLGLVTIDSSAKLFGVEDLYTFVHLTFQEYLAAYYISGLNYEQQLEVASSYGTGDQFKRVWKFFCGMIKFDEKVLLHHISAGQVLNMVQFAFESQQQIVCNCVFEMGKKDILSLTNYSLIPSDLLAIGYVISTTRFTVKMLDFTNCNFLDEKSIKLYVDSLTSHNFISVKHLKYHNENYSIDQLKNFNILLKKMIFIEVFDLEGTAPLVPEAIEALTNSVELNNLETLKIFLPFRNITSNDVKILKSLKFSSAKLKEVWYTSNAMIESCYILNLSCALNGICIVKTDQLLCCNSFLPSMPSTNNLMWCNRLILLNASITDNHMRYLADTSIHSSSIITFQVDFNQITSVGANLLSCFLQKCKQLEYFSAHCNYIEDSGALAIASVCSQISSLKILDLQCNPISKEGQYAIAEIFQGVGPDLNLYVTSNERKLWYEQNLSTIQQSVDVICNGNASSINKALKNCSFVPQILIKLTKYGTLQNFQEFVTFNCTISEDPANFISLISNGVENVKNLVSLECDCNWNTDDQGSVTIADTIKNWVNLESLLLAGSGIGSRGAMAVADKLQFWTILRVLDLKSNSIGVDGTRAICGALKYCSKLEILDLHNNNIDSESMGELGDGLKNCNRLQKIDLSYNNIGSESNYVMVLAETLKSLRTLKYIYLHFNVISSKDAIQIANKLSGCSSLESVTLYGNKLLRKDKVKVRSIFSNVQQCIV